MNSNLHQNVVQLHVCIGVVGGGWWVGFLTQKQYLKISYINILSLPAAYFNNFFYYK